MKTFHGPSYLLTDWCLCCSLSPGMADARNRLQEITNDLFEELTTDVYDEVDRRETDSGEIHNTSVPIHISVSVCHVLNVFICFTTPHQRY